jgi:hypothetical protein
MSRRGFNLLREQLTPPTAWDKIYDWMVGTARIIVIVVEIIVIIAFGARIILDTIGGNLDRTIAEEIDPQLESFAQLEEEFRQTQRKNDNYTELYRESSSLTPYHLYAEQLLSVDRNLQGTINVQISGERFVVNGELLESDVKELENDIKSRVVGNDDENPLFLDATLVDISSRGQGNNEFSTFSIEATVITSEQGREI